MTKKDIAGNCIVALKNSQQLINTILKQVLILTTVSTMRPGTELGFEERKEIMWLLEKHINELVNDTFIKFDQAIERLKEVSK